MIIKIIVVVLFLFIVGSLASALFYLLTSQEENNKTVRALTVRIGLSVLAFVILMLGINFGWIEPHGLNPNR